MNLQSSPASLEQAHLHQNTAQCVPAILHCPSLPGTWELPPRTDPQEEHSAFFPPYPLSLSILLGSSHLDVLTPFSRGIRSSIWSCTLFLHLPLLGPGTPVRNEKLAHVGLGALGMLAESLSPVGAQSELGMGDTSAMGSGDLPQKE